MEKLATVPQIEREWIIAPPHPERERLAREARIAPLLAQILLRRDVRTATEARQFLTPDFRALHPPERLPGAVEAAERLTDAAQHGRRIVIYGDYDVDGVTATAILWHGLKLAGGDVDFYIPSRSDEGYGLNVKALEQIKRDGADVVVTVDCGITSHKEARLARQLGLELIITDHHEPRETLPDVDVIVHPTACGEDSANPHLSGAGVALKVAWALAQRACGTARVTSDYRDYLLDATAFAALGLVADIVPLIGENRVIASFGLRHLRETKNPGLQALIEASGLSGRKSYDEYDVGFVLAPRLNAVGRLGHARLAAELFTRANPERAAEIAATLNAQNRQRQQVEREIVKQATEMVIAGGFDREGRRAIVLAAPEWHAGVIGIVASRMVDRFHRPTILIALDEQIGRGSGRSIRHFPLHEVLTECEEHLISHGGHAMAAGVKIKPDQVAAFTDAFLAQAAQRLTSADLVPKLHLDDEVALGDLTPELVDAIQRMGPFGVGNRKVKLATRRVELVEQPRAVGQGAQHLQFTVREDRIYRKAIAFGRGSRIDELRDHPTLRLAFEPIINEWNGRRNVDLKVADWKWDE